MRIDKFLKVSRLFKRRTVAQQACQAGRIRINGRTAKPGSVVQTGDMIEVVFASGSRKFEILEIPADPRKTAEPCIREVEGQSSDTMQS